jgi:hypothetical protein
MDLEPTAGPARAASSIDAIDQFDGKVPVFIEKCPTIWSQCGQRPAPKIETNRRAFARTDGAPSRTPVQGGVAVEERVAEIPTRDGRMQAFVTHPQQDGPFPPVILYMDVWGVREELCDLARRVATVGYYCMVPDLYYRQGKVRSTYVNDKGERISLNRLSKESRTRAGAGAQSVRPDGGRDTGAVLKFYTAESL